MFEGLFLSLCNSFLLSETHLPIIDLGLIVELGVSQGFSLFCWTLFIFIWRGANIFGCDYHFIWFSGSFLRFVLIIVLQNSPSIWGVFSWNFLKLAIPCAWWMLVCIALRRSIFFEFLITSLNERFLILRRIQSQLLDLHLCLLLGIDEHIDILSRLVWSVWSKLCVYLGWIVYWSINRAPISRSITKADVRLDNVHQVFIFWGAPLVQLSHVVFWQMLARAKLEEVLLNHFLLFFEAKLRRRTKGYKRFQVRLNIMRFQNGGFIQNTGRLRFLDLCCSRLWSGIFIEGVNGA